jgi:TPP-dependent pyruvate/acetoin dehydrogenase alpha subunit
MKEVSKEQKLELFNLLLKTRRLEERLLELFSAAAFPGWIHSALGQESVGIGVTYSLRPDDYITSTHRARGIFLTKGVDMKLFMAETYGRKNGPSKGRGGEMRFMDLEHGIIASSGLIGEHIPLATGVAYSCKYRGTDQVTVSLFGDGAVNTGGFHESLNVASLWKLPVVYVCENNGWSQFTAQTATASVLDISKKAVAYNMRGVTVDGNDVLAVYEAAQEAVSRAREASEPTLLECKTHRWLGHFAGDPQKYRDPEELKNVRKYDPVSAFQEKLLKEGILTTELIEEAEKKIKAEIDEAVEFAEQSPFPEPEEAIEGVYC